MKVFLSLLLVFFSLLSRAETRIVKISEINIIKNKINEYAIYASNGEIYELKVTNDHLLKDVIWAHKNNTSLELILSTYTNSDDFLETRSQILDVTRITTNKLTRKNLTSRSRSNKSCLLYTSPSPRDKRQSRMPSSA